LRAASCCAETKSSARQTGQIEAVTHAITNTNAKTAPTYREKRLRCLPGISDIVASAPCLGKTGQFLRGFWISECSTSRLHLDFCKTAPTARSNESADAYDQPIRSGLARIRSLGVYANRRPSYEPTISGPVAKIQSAGRADLYGFRCSPRSERFGRCQRTTTSHSWEAERSSHD
jgi:hypothetical protein